MPYTPFYADWHNFPTTDTPASAAAMEHIEAGIVTAQETAEAALADGGGGGGGGGAATAADLPFEPTPEIPVDDTQAAVELAVSKAAVDLGAHATDEATHNIPGQFNVRNLFSSLAADKTFTPSNIVLQDSGLAVAVEASMLYVVQMLLWIDGATNADFNLAFSGPAGVGGSVFVSRLDTGAVLAAKNAWGTTILIDAPGAGTPLPLLVKGLLRVAGTAGTFKVRGSQAVAQASNTKMLVDSTMTLDRRA